MIRILFVDDEPHVLDGIRRSFYAMRTQWEMRFAASGAEALAELERKPVDVVVADMRMPGMDGGELLEVIRQRYPRTTRFILSGYADRDAIMRVVGTAHQYLSKPCDSAVLKVAIARAEGLGQVLQSERAAELAGRIRSLPSLPGTYQELLGCLRRPDPTIGDVGRVISRDLAMSAVVLKLVNSAFFGPPHPIRSLDRAVAFLGLDTIGSLVLGHGLFRQCESARLAGTDLERLWNHSLATAASARAIAIYEGWERPRADEAFLAGLLHDVGRLVLLEAPASSPAAGTREDDHAIIGAHLLGLWGFGHAIAEATAFHHRPSRAADGYKGLSAIVHAADFFAHDDAGDRPDPLDLDVGFVRALDADGRWSSWRGAWPGCHARVTTA